MSRHLLSPLRRLARPLGRLLALWLLLFALLPLARAAWVPPDANALAWDQVCVASLDGVPHVMEGAPAPAVDPIGSRDHVGSDCQLCPQGMLGDLALPGADVGAVLLRPLAQPRTRTTLASPASRPARHSAQPRAPPQA
jgi:hypothetical protein